MQIGLISDTHGYLDDRVFHHFENCDEIWHAGDIGSIELLEQLESFKPTVAVYGNIDSHKVRLATAEDIFIEREGLKIFMTHIGGYPPKYNRRTTPIIKSEQPDIYICGHSHIVKVIRDPRYNLLHINPGAAGIQGFHKVRTLVRFTLESEQIKDLQIIELGSRVKA